jgi:hypothetical protein
VSDVIEIPKIIEGDDWCAKSPGWAPSRSTDGKMLKPIIRCNCGQWSGIGLHHVHADGTVTNSFYHKRGTVFPEDPNGCDWHVWLKLKDYDCGDFPPEP